MQIAISIALASKWRRSGKIDPRSRFGSGWVQKSNIFLLVPRSTSPKIFTKIHPQLLMSKTPCRSIMEKWKKIILDPDPDPDRFKNLINVPCPELYFSRKFYERSPTKFWVILFNVYVHFRKFEKSILNAHPDPAESQNLIGMAIGSLVEQSTSFW